jgi:hypothetical protein
VEARSVPEKKVPTKTRPPAEEDEAEVEAEVARIDPAPIAQPSRRRRDTQEEDDEEAESPEKARPRRRPKAEDEENDDTEEEERPRRPKRAGGRKARWRRVRLGLLLMLVAVGIGLGVAVLLNLTMRISLSSASGIFASVQSLLTWMRIFQFLTFCQTAVAITGYCFCLFVPREHSCRKLAIAVLVVASLDLLCQTVFDPLNLSSLGFGGQSIETMMDQAARGDLSAIQRWTLDLSSWVQRMYLFGMFIQVLSYAKVLLVPIFIWSLTRCLPRSGLTYNAETLLKISFWIVAMGILSQLLFRLPLTVVVHIFTPLSWVNTLLALAQTVWMLLLLINLRRAITDKLEG